METLKIEIYIPIGKENAVSREFLRTMTGLGDRKIRQMIEAARDEGNIIINDQDGKGYYQAADIDEIERQYWQDTRRALSILKRRKHARRILKEAGRNV